MTASPNPQPPTARTPRLWALSLTTLGIVLVAHLGSSLLWRVRLPDPAATHWGGSGVADGTNAGPGHQLSSRPGPALGWFLHPAFTTA